MSNAHFLNLRSAIVNQNKKGEDIEDTIKQLDKTINNWDTHLDMNKTARPLVR